MNKQNYDVLSKIIGAVESGGQVYGNARYDAYADPYTNTPNEHTITLGWAQNYGAEAKKLIKMIYDKDPAAFEKLDTAGIKSMLAKDWVAIRWNPTAGQKKVLIKLISSDIGKQCQDELFAELMEKFVADCEATYAKDVPAVMMYCEIRHLGGKTAADRIFKRCNGDYSLDSIMAALKRDQDDTSSSNQVGDKKFWSRHQKCVEFINKYAVKEDSEKKDTRTPLQRAKILLRQPQGDVMTGYTPDGKQCFVDAGAWTKTPQRGYVIYFYSTSKGRVGHVGIVEKVDAANKTVHTVEGNTSSTEYAENGGCVARHSYSYAAQGGTNRVNGFGVPNFSGAGVTADEFVATAVSYLGYLEKKSNKDLDSKTANAGSNNYQKFQRDVGAGNGDQWCQYFVDACALYACQGSKYDRDELMIGDRGNAVAEMQKMLIACGYSCGSAGADGIFGSDTEKALKSFQSASGLVADGLYGEKSRNALTNAYAAKQAPATGNKKVGAATTLLKAAKNVTETARVEGWTYGDSHSKKPCADKKISCDRLIARTLFDLGFRDQRDGGETCETLDKYLVDHGWKKVTDKASIKAGAVVAVRSKKHNYIDHVFIVKSYNKTKDTCAKYDEGSDQRINSVQPFKNVPLVEWPDKVFVCAWNVPACLASSKPKLYTWGGVDYGAVFNPTYYAKMYPDLKAAYGTDSKKLFDHFLRTGMKEGRQAYAGFCVHAYRDRYSDLRKAFGADLPRYYRHYCEFGLKEKRIST